MFLVRMVYICVYLVPGGSRTGPFPHLSLTPLFSPAGPILWLLASLSLYKMIWNSRWDPVRYPWGLPSHGTEAVTRLPSSSSCSPPLPAGIPKFYRWLSERYPQLNQPVKKYGVPVRVEARLFSHARRDFIMQQQDRRRGVAAPRFFIAPHPAALS
jgi:hypothetical protein